MNFIALALRNVFRAKARSGITVAALFFGVGMSLLLGAFVLGVGESLVDETVQARVGALQVHRHGYFEARDRQPLALDLPQDAAIEAKVRAVPGVAAVTPRIIFSGMVSNGSRGTMAVVTAIDAATQGAALPRAAGLVDGEALAAGEPQSAIMGAELAHALTVKPGASLLLQAQGKDKRENALDLDLKATFGGSNPLESKRSLTVPLALAQRLLGMQGRVTEYVVAVSSMEKLDETAAAVRAALGPDYEVHTWSELRPALKDVRGFQAAVLGLISFVFLVIAIFGVANTLLMSVMERTREIGTLLAVGMTRAQVAALFVIEAGAQATLGASAALAVVYLVVHGLVARGGVQLSIDDGAAKFTVYPQLVTSSVTAVVVTAVVGALLAALYPAWRASKLRPVEALSAA